MILLFFEPLLPFWKPSSSILKKGQYLLESAADDKDDNDDNDDDDDDDDNDDNDDNGDNDDNYDNDD